MTIIKRITSFCIALLLLVLAIPHIFAYPVLDLEQDGSITLQIAYQGQPVPGGTITIYRIASITETAEYVPEPGFQNCSMDLTPKNAEALAVYALEHGIPGESRTPDESGVVSFLALKPGLYLLVQTTPPEKFLPLKPFFSGIPQLIDGELVYDLIAHPKCAPVPTETTTPDPTTPTTPDMPQTGQLNWPVPMLAGLGLIFVTMGLFLRSGPRDKRREA